MSGAGTPKQENNSNIEHRTDRNLDYEKTTHPLNIRCWKSAMFNFSMTLPPSIRRKNNLPIMG